MVGLGDDLIIGHCNRVINVYAAGMRIILIRHYKTQTNEDGRILGWDDSPPCQDWKTDFDFVDALLTEQGVNIDAVYSSDLERSRQTAKLHARVLGISTVSSSAELNEVNYGEVQQKRKSWVAANYPEHKKNPDMVYSGGESFRQMQQRSVRYISALAEAHPKQSALVVAHAGVIRGLICHFLGLEYAGNLERRIPFRYIGDFLFKGKHCVRYKELGRPSGFVRDRVIKIPFKPGSTS